MSKYAALLAVAGILLCPCTGWAEDQDHSLHQAAMRGALQVSEADYTPPLETILTERSGRAFTLAELMATDEPLLLQFIFTTCPTICPVLSVSFSGLQKKLEQERLPFRLISISIDPEYDTPAVLTAYAEKFKAGDNWFMLTGDQEQVRLVQSAFEAYFGVRKMDHQPLTFIRPSRTQPWRRIAGLPSPAELFAQYLKATGLNKAQADRQGETE